MNATNIDMTPNDTEKIKQNIRAYVNESSDNLTHFMSIETISDMFSIQKIAMKGVGKGPSIVGMAKIVAELQHNL